MEFWNKTISETCKNHVKGPGYTIDGKKILLILSPDTNKNRLEYLMKKVKGWFISEVNESNCSLLPPIDMTDYKGKHSLRDFFKDLRKSLRNKNICVVYVGHATDEGLWYFSSDHEASVPLKRLLNALRSKIDLLLQFSCGAKLTM